MSKADFFYPNLYDIIDVDEHIQRYAPRNRFNKMEFEETLKEERLALFHEVVEAIHNKGIGLDRLAYSKVSDQQQVALFTEAEVIHLKDVANLIEKLKPVLIGVTMFWLLLLFFMFMRRIELPSATRFTLNGLILIGCILLLLSLGPEKVFNQLHIWVFPDEHQWFFYYEESLMSTMMKAPDLFAYISIIWFVISVLMTVFLLKLMHLIKRSKR